MSISVFDLFKIGIGPSSSHTVGPMHAARLFALGLRESGKLERCERVCAELYGSLGATGAGHGSPKAVILGLEGESPESVQVSGIAERVNAVREESRLTLVGTHPIDFSYRNDLVMHRTESLLTFAVCAWLVWRVWKLATPGGAQRRMGALLLGVFAVEIVTGAFMYYFAIPPYLQPVHLLLASVGVGVLFALWMSVRYGSRAAT